MENASRKILVPSGLKMLMHRELGYSRPTINRALDGADDTHVAREIRSYALEHGGAEVVPVRWEQVDGKTWVRKQ
ncbi:MAG: hypothetical protein IJ756_02895 [Paludibacteraceae bacterium]|nr:hypothetical protein [Paludibacteraceae bacterium]